MKDKLVVVLIALLVITSACSTNTKITSYPTSTPDPSYYASDRNIVHVTRVIDGDTVEVRFESGESDKVRIIGVDTPEIFSPNQASEYGNITDLDCLDKWGDAATKYARDILNNKINIGQNLIMEQLLIMSNTGFFLLESIDNDLKSKF